jgi:uncharacterized membrane protein (UPF0127 family)
MFEGFCRKNDIDKKEIVARISGTPLKLIVAANDDTKAKGLMDSDEPDGNNGMIFIYENPSILDFWMKNVDYALDILFFDAELNLVDHFTMDPYNGESDDDLKIYKSKEPAQYAVELKSGWADSNLKDSDLTLKF